MEYPIDELEHENLGKSVYALLRESLATGRFRPNTRLRIRDLAAQLGTSVTPVRDAILQLAKEEALVLRSPRDIRVPVLTVEKFLEIRAIRLELEGLGAATAAMRIDPKTLTYLEDLLAHNEQAIEEGDMSAALQWNQAFHLGLADAASMPTLRGFIDRLWMQTAPLIAAAYESFSESMRVGHHRDILRALRDRDSDGARRAIRDDILEGGEKMLEFIRSFRSTDD
ncbi:GntR family transcriptional regulator [Burkholderia pseudomallei]|uniref:GntR family transcriptional regulator n=1 Tax=Burkholderia pseudomallei TaxID=28450 RepID=UPI00048FEACF|nr:GntR family transcriptional regulator [Burkholderia pseudomallei]AJX94470.1 bacterial regulatory s, gntR family protein [Burkholderia pseudomallei PB08298010]